MESSINLEMKYDKIEIHNRQRSTVVFFLTAAILMFVLAVLPFIEDNP